MFRKILSKCLKIFNDLFHGLILDENISLVFIIWKWGFMLLLLAFSRHSNPEYSDFTSALFSSLNERIEPLIEWFSDFNHSSSKSIWEKCSSSRPSSLKRAVASKLTFSKLLSRSANERLSMISLLDSLFLLVFYDRLFSQIPFFYLIFINRHFIFFLN